MTLGSISSAWTPADISRYQALADSVEKDDPSLFQNYVNNPSNEEKCPRNPRSLLSYSIEIFLRSCDQFDDWDSKKLTPSQRQHIDEVVKKSSEYMKLHEGLSKSITNNNPEKSTDWLQLGAKITPELHRQMIDHFHTAVMDNDPVKAKLWRTAGAIPTPNTQKHLDSNLRVEIMLDSPLTPIFAKNWLIAGAQPKDTETSKNKSYINFMNSLSDDDWAYMPPHQADYWKAKCLKDAVITNDFIKIDKWLKLGATPSGNTQDLMAQQAINCNTKKIAENWIERVAKLPNNVQKKILQEACNQGEIDIVEKQVKRGLTFKTTMLNQGLKNACTQGNAQQANRWIVLGADKDLKLMTRGLNNALKKSPLEALQWKTMGLANTDTVDQKILNYKLYQALKMDDPEHATACLELGPTPSPKNQDRLQVIINQTFNGEYFIGKYIRSPRPGCNFKEACIETIEQIEEDQLYIEQKSQQNTDKEVLNFYREMMKIAPKVFKWRAMHQYLDANRKERELMNAIAANDCRLVTFWKGSGVDTTDTINRLLEQKLEEILAPNATDREVQMESWTKICSSLGANVQVWTAECKKKLNRALLDAIPHLRIDVASEIFKLLGNHVSVKPALNTLLKDKLDVILTRHTSYNDDEMEKWIRLCANLSIDTQAWLNQAQPVMYERLMDAIRQGTYPSHLLRALGSNVTVSPTLHTLLKDTLTEILTDDKLYHHMKVNRWKGLCSQLEIAPEDWLLDARPLINKRLLWDVKAENESGIKFLKKFGADPSEFSDGIKKALKEQLEKIIDNPKAFYEYKIRCWQERCILTAVDLNECIESLKEQQSNNSWAVGVLESAKYALPVAPAA